MKNFKDIDALHKVLVAAFVEGEGEPGRRLFALKLRELAGFNERQSELYASTTLSQNSNGSADRVSMNAGKLEGTWVKGDSTGSAGNLVVAKTEIWTFSDDLTYRHEHRSYEGYSSPFGSGYSRQSPSSETGIWAPCDRLDDEIQVVVIATTGWCRPLKVGWLGSTRMLPPVCTLDRVRFTRQ